MGQVLHGCATTTHAVRAAIQRLKAPLQDLAARLLSRAGLRPRSVPRSRPGLASPVSESDGLSSLRSPALHGAGRHLQTVSRVLAP